MIDLCLPLNPCIYFVHLFIYPSICLSVCPSTHQYIYLYTCLFIYLPAYLSIQSLLCFSLLCNNLSISSITIYYNLIPSNCLSLRLPDYLSTHPPTHPPTYLPACLLSYPSYLPIFLSIYPIYKSNLIYLSIRQKSSLRTVQNILLVLTKSSLI